MLIKSIQNKQVLQTLLNNKIHYSDRNIYNLPDNLQKPYDRMSKHYGWDHWPIFGCEVGRYCEFYGAIYENSVLLTLTVPDIIAKRQIYYDWTDLIYFMERPNAWESGSFSEFIKNTLDGKNTDKKTAIIQVTLPYIKPEWLVKYENISEQFIKDHIDSGGSYILE